MNKLPSTLLKYIIASVAFILLIWALGPYLAINGKIPFHSPLARLVPTVLLAFIWIAYGLIVLIHKKLSKTPSAISLTPLADNFIQLTREALHSMRRSRAPWVLMLGKEKSGKTTLLSNTEIDFQVKSAQAVDWWVSNTGVFIDPVGNLCLPDSTDTQERWLQFLKYLRSKRGKHTFDAVILTVDLTTLANDDALEKLVSRLVEQVAFISQYNRATNITLVITQCDRMRGFQEFFADLGPEERQQGLGFILSDSLNTPLRELYQERFNAFISRISDRLIWRLHHEQNLSRRSRIKDFPLQLEKLRTAIEKLIDKLPLNSKIHVKGIYFTSSIQTGNIINLLAEPISENFQLLDAKAVHHTTRQKPYFIQALLNKLIFDSNEQIAPSPKIWKRWIGYPAALVILSAGVFFWHHAYRKNIMALNTVTTTLTKLSANTTWFVRINNLQKALLTLNQHSTNYYRWFGFDQAAKLQEQIRATYQHLIRTDFVLYLDQLLTKKIQTSINQDHSDLYNSLQVYLMLVKSSHTNSQMIKNWFGNLWTDEFQQNKNRQQQLMEHLNYLLTLKDLSWPADYDLISQAQSVLQKQPLAQTAFLALKSEYKDKLIPLLADESIRNLNVSHLLIPAIYNRKNFKKIYNEQIPRIASNIEKGNWVIGNMNTTAAEQTQYANLTEQVQAIYLKKYTQEWQTILSSIQLAKPQHLAQALTEIRMLQDPNSPIWKLLNDVIKNTIAPSNVPDTAQSNNLGSLIAFLHKNDNYQATQVALQDLHNYIAKIAVSSSITKAAYNTAVDRMQNNGNNDPITTLLQVSKQLPTPINQWLKNLADGSWESILDSSRQYLSNVWASSVVPEYNSHIINRFPIFKDSKQDISIKDFNHFFGPGGTMESFFNDYLKTFVNTDKAYWTLKSLDGQHLNIPQQALDMLIRASIIQKIFYSDNPDSPMIRFNLTPMNLSPNISRFEINIGGQMLSFEPGIKKSSHLSWPGKDGDFITMRFNTISANSPTTTFTGPWAWLHLINQSTIESTNNPEEYQVTFTLKDNKARYQLVADSPVNPYQTEIVSAFRAPDTL
ncbi:ImcF-related family protein [Candidiatus Paracoxiella cheracis]|uniref:ImcF-related family protein n=1 Tax=Candidiatus Paracoxiella cheracis TaxID=3405120 RepID=UPI003BF465A3